MAPAMMQPTPGSAPAVLRIALRANAVFSSLSAVLCVLLAGPLAAHIAIGTSGFLQLAVQLFIFAVVLVVLASRWVVTRWWVGLPVLVVILLDGAWVIGSFFLASLPSMATETGQVLIRGTAMVVGGLGLAQLYGLVRFYRRRRTASRHRQAKTLAAGLLLLMVLGTGCSATDIRPVVLQQEGHTEVAAERGQDLLRQAAQAHGLSAWEAFTVFDGVGVDRWAEGAGSWWPAQDQKLRFQALLGTFTSRVHLLDGEQPGAIWGIQAWRPYKRVRVGAPVRFEPVNEERTAMTFYLPALQYFNELPFRLLGAEYVVYAGERTYRGQDYDLVFATWGSLEPTVDYDQYLLWINKDTHLIEMCRYTVRDIDPPIFTGTIHFDDYREVQGVRFPFKQTVILPAPEHTLYPLDENYFHQVIYDSVRFDRVEPDVLLVDTTLVVGDVKPLAP